MHNYVSIYNCSIDGSSVYWIDISTAVSHPVGAHMA